MEEPFIGRQMLEIVRPDFVRGLLELAPAPEMGQNTDEALRERGIDCATLAEIGTKRAIL